MLFHDRIETQFKDFKTALNETEAVTEASRCINCYDAPCIHACPTEINIPQFISRIANQNHRGAAQTILNSNIFGLSCAQACPTEVLCEGACVYQSLNKKPITIGKLQRFATEFAYENKFEFFKPGKSNGKKIALVGAGPASYACAHELRILGYETTIFEKTKIKGGLNTTGIAPYKMKANTSIKEIERIEKMGIEVKYDQEFGKNLELDFLINHYDAVFLGMGLGPDSKLDLPNSNHPRVIGAVEFIAKIKTNPAEELSFFKNVKTAMVIGGGNTALDACRELKQLGVERVIVSYRRGQTDMSGYLHEFNCAKQEGVEFRFFTIPVQCESLGNQVKLTVSNTKIDSNGKVIPTGNVHSLDFDLVLVATGQNKLESLFKNSNGLIFEKGKLKVNPATGQTGNPKVFAGGDLINGGMEVVNAVAEGKRAAHGIHQSLSKV